MKVYNIDEMKGGWFIGDFEPSVFKNCFFEVAHHRHEAGYRAEYHTHKIAQELTYILNGKMKVSGQILTKGDIFIYEPYEVADALVLDDVDLIVVKWPSVPSDKFSTDKEGNIL